MSQSDLIEGAFQWDKGVLLNVRLISPRNVVGCVALVDCGASHCAATENLLKELRIRPQAVVARNLQDPSTTSPLYRLDITIDNLARRFNNLNFVQREEPADGRYGALIGRELLRYGDVLLTRTGRYRFEF